MNVETLPEVLIVCVAHNSFRNLNKYIIMFYINFFLMLTHGLGCILSLLVSYTHSSTGIFIVYRYYN